MAYEINININDKSESESVVKGMSPTSPEKQAKYQSALNTYIASQMIQPVIQEVKTRISSDIYMYTGRSDLQARVNNTIEAIQFGVSTIQTIGATTALAVSAGYGKGVGIISGAMLTAATFGLNVGFNAYERTLNERSENITLSQAKSRLANANNRSRI